MFKIKHDILVAAVKKAYRGGWGKYKDEEDLNEIASSYVGDMDDGLYENTIFRKDFAQTFWKDDTITVIDKTYTIYRNNQSTTIIEQEPLTYWQYQLQKMVISPDPLQYLAQFLPTN